MMENYIIKWGNPFAATVTIKDKVTKAPINLDDEYSKIIFTAKKNLEQTDEDASIPNKELVFDDDQTTNTGKCYLNISAEENKIEAMTYIADIKCFDLDGIIVNSDKFTYTVEAVVTQNE